MHKKKGPLYNTQGYPLLSVQRAMHWFDCATVDELKIRIKQKLITRDQVKRICGMGPKTLAILFPVKSK